ncbi:MAG: NUDIX domain-containing protein [Acidobacteria bacterium]|nr:NUDIX domain-containing protein [Acidobacteriota bacterium]
MSRPQTHLAMIAAQVLSESGNIHCALQLNRHLDGYNFIGGHVEAGERPVEAALREFREEVGSAELRDRWGLEISTADPPDSEWTAIAKELELQTIAPAKCSFTVPFDSIRARREGMPSERLARVSLFQFRVDRVRFSGIHARLSELVDRKVCFGESGSQQALCRLFDTAELLSEAWSNPHNPFLRSALKAEVLPNTLGARSAPPYILDVPALEAMIQRSLGDLFTGIFGADSGLDLRILAPGTDELELCRSANRTLKALFEVRWGGSADVLRLRLPFPWEGVFVLHSDARLAAPSGDSSPALAIWRSRLVGRPGLWRVRATPGDDEELRLVLSRRWKLELRLKQLQGLSRGKNLPKTASATVKRLGDLIEPVAHGLAPEGSLSSTKIVHGESDVKHIIQWLAEHGIEHTSSLVDLQSLEHQRLYTYSAHLAETLPRILAHHLIFSANASDKQDLVAALRNRKKVETATANRAWDRLIAGSSLLERQIVPLAKFQREGFLQPFSPVNPLEVLSELTAVQRYDWPGETLDKLPAWWRQNHPSFRGVFCPVESPESEKVGVTLHLARGVETDVRGVLRTSGSAEADGDLGWGASLVPFYQHNDGARSMMAAKNLKQAVPVAGRHVPAIRTGHEKAVTEATRSLARSGLSPDLAEAAPGVDLLVAYMPWYGLNFEDAIVANRRLADEGILDWIEETEYTRRLLPGVTLAEPVITNPFEAFFRERYFDEHGLRRPGPVTPESPIAFLRLPDDVTPLPVFCGGYGPGELVEAGYAAPSEPWMGGLLRWKLRGSEPLDIGDKLMGRYGNKGVISALTASSELPRLPDDERLPPKFRGRAVDLVLNPHGVISRMNLGQLLETHLGLLLALDTGAPFAPTVGRAFQNADLKAISAAFVKISRGHEPAVVDAYGRMRLHLPDGGQTQAPVVVGFQYFCRLSHVAARKANWRSGGPEVGDRKRLYDLATGQPVQGKRNRGGQRVGEMEVWALAAHGAEKNLAAILLDRCDPSAASRSDNTHLGGQTFEAIRDHLFALGVDLEQRSGGLVPVWASPGTIRSRGKEVTRSAAWRLASRARFHCPKCNYNIEYDLHATQSRQRGGSPRVSIDDFLTGLGYRAEIEQVEPIGKPQRGSKVKREIRVALSGKFDRKDIRFSLERADRSLHLKFGLDGREYHGYRQVDGTVEWNELTNVPLACLKHTTFHLVPNKAPVTIVPVPRGVYDPAVFGEPDVTAAATSWGFIEIPKGILYPKAALSLRSKDHPPRLEVLPVLPLKYRYRSPGHTARGFAPRHHPITRRYIQILETIETIRNTESGVKGTISTEGQTRQIERLRDLIGQLFVVIHGQLFGTGNIARRGLPRSPKMALARRKGLGRRVDGSARLVIVPDPKLLWNECAIPAALILELLGHSIAVWDRLDEAVGDPAIDRLLRAIFPNSYELRPEVSTEVRNFVRSPRFWTTIRWGDPVLDREHLALAEDVVRKYLDAHPEIRVLLNRQPSLHRYSVMAFRPRILSVGEGMVLKIHPLVCKGFGADFDGDEMALHFPMTKEEYEEAKKLEPTAPSNLRSVANGSPVATFDQDFVLGHFLLSRSDEGRQKLRARMPRDCERCQALLGAPGVWRKDHGLKLLDHLCAKHRDRASEVIPEWMHLAFETVTRAGISFGFIELAEISDRFGNLPSTPASPNADALRKWTMQIGKTALEPLEELCGEARPLADPGAGFATLAVSGTRGDKQSRQIIAARGFLDPGELGFEADPNKFFSRRPLVAGMSPEEAFWAAMNARSSMIDKKLSTPQAGDITRQLVLAAWPWHLVGGDCGVKRIPRLLHCKRKKEQRICITCYADGAEFGVVSEGFPAGLIAAQSFGERGTQLSMQSFHIGERQLSIQEIKSLLEGRDPNPGKGREAPYDWFARRADTLPFVQRIRREDAYAKLGEHHLMLLWLIIHSSPKKGLRSAWEINATPLATLAGPAPWPALVEAIRRGKTRRGKTAPSDPLESPFVRVLLGRPPMTTTTGRSGRREESQDAD